MPDTGKRDAPIARHAFPDASVDEERVRKTATVLAMEILSVVFAVADVILLAIDFTLNRAFTWSPYPAAAVTALWIYVVLMLIIAKRPYKTLAISAFVIILLLAAIDFADGAMSWFLPLGLPISISVFLLIFLIFLVIQIGKNHSLVSVAISVSVCIESCVVDYVVSRYLGMQPFTWSLIVAACMAPVVVVSLIHYFFLSRYFDIEKYLHF
jgi:hypothetical protein